MNPEEEFIENEGDYYEDEEYDEDYDEEKDLGPIPEDKEAALLELFAKPLKNSYQNCSRWVASYPDEWDVHSNTICHAALRPIREGINLFASNFDVHEGDEELGERYWDWITGDESPYRSLFENGRPEKIFGTEGTQTGFRMNCTDIVDPKKTTLLYNFCIAMRMIHECSREIRMWDQLVNRGMHPVDALYLGRMISITGDTCVFDDANDGSHWPLWFKSYGNWYNGRSDYNYIDFEKLRTSTPNFEGKSCGQWTTKLKRGFELTDYVTKINPVIVSKGRFSKTEGIPLNEVIEEFLKWVKKHQEVIERNKK